MNTLLYHETQRMFGSVLLICVIIPFLLFVFYQFRPRPLPVLTRVASIVVCVMAAFLISVLATLRLDTLYYPDRVEYQFVSLFSAKYEVQKMNAARKATMIVYNPEDYGGWGMKGNATTRVYNAAGNTGLLLNMYSGKNLVIGSSHPDSLYARIKAFYPF